MKGSTNENDLDKYISSHITEEQNWPPENVSLACWLFWAESNQGSEEALAWGNTG